MRAAICMILIIASAVLAAEELRPDQEIFLDGAKAFDAGQYTTAAELFERLQRSYPNSPLACPCRYALAEVYYSLQRYAPAMRELNGMDASCIRLIGRGKVLLRKAWALYHMDRRDEAGRLFLSAVESGGIAEREQQYAMVMAGDVAYERGDMDAAIRSYNRIITGSVPIPLACQVYSKIGRAHLRAGNAGGARSAFTKVLELNPGSEYADDALYGRAWSQRMQKNYTQAAANWTQLTANYPNSPLVAEARFRLGEENYRLKDYPNAILAFDSVPESSDFGDDAAYWRAWAYIRMEEYSKAAYAFDQLRVKYPQSRLVEDSRFRAAESHRDAGEYDLAIMGYRVVIELGKDREYYIPSLYGMAQSSAMSGNLADAERYRTELLSTRRAGDFAPRVFFDLGVAAYNRKQYQTAIREFSTLINRYPDHTLMDEGLYELGLSYMREEQYDDAIQILRRCVELYPDGVAGRNAAYQLGWALFRSGEYQRSADQFIRVAAQGGENALDARYRAGDALYNAEKYREAIGIYQQVIDLSPGSDIAAVAQNSIGWCYDRMGRAVEAIGAFQIVVDRYPRSGIWDDSAYKVAEYYHSREDYQLSVPVLQEIRDTPTSSFWESSLLMLGEGLWQLDRKNDALSALRTLLEREQSPLRQDALLLLGELNWEEKRWSQARGYYTQFVEEFPNHELVSLALLRVADGFAAEEIWEQASQAYTRASVAGADQNACLMGRCRAAASLGDCTSAERSAGVLEAQYADYTQTGDAIFWAGNCFYDSGDDERAVRLLLKVPILYPDSEYADDALLYVAKARIRQQRPDQAERQLDLLLEKYPGSPHRAEAQRLLTSMGGSN